MTHTGNHIRLEVVARPSRWLLMFLLATPPGSVQAQFNYVTNEESTITITSYTGSDSTVILPEMIEGIPVTRIGFNAFGGNTNLIKVVVGNGILAIEGLAFLGCRNLSSVTIPDSVAFIWSMAFAECTSLAEVQLGDGLVYIGDWAFGGCTNMTSVVIGSGVTGVDEAAFAGCRSLTGIYFEGNAPSFGPNVFDSDSRCMVFHLPNTTGWQPYLAGRPTTVWLPRTGPINRRMDGLTNEFGFCISWASDLTVVVEASVNLAKPVWIPIGTNTIIGRLSHFSDPAWTNYPTRFYRIRSP